MEGIAKATFKKIDTVGDLMRYLKKVNPKEKVTMFSDEEGNQVNKILYLDLFVEGLTLIPFENWEEKNLF